MVAFYFPFIVCKYKEKNRKLDSLKTIHQSSRIYSPIKFSHSPMDYIYW